MLGQLSVEDGEGGETEEDIDDVGGEIDALLPVVSQNPGQSQEQRFWRGRRKGERRREGTAVIYLASFCVQ